jgi:hypothetical protein
VSCGVRTVGGVLGGWCSSSLVVVYRRVPSQATVHRVLVRNGLVRAEEQDHPRKYKRWQRETPMHLWQLDLVGGMYLADGREFKLLTGIDDHSRYVVVAAVLAVPNGRAVCEAFTAAMDRYGVPSEVLTDNGKQFTGRFTKPMPAEVFFERERSSGSSAPRRTWLYPRHSREGLEGRFLGLMAYPQLKGRRGDKSMPGNRRPGPDVRDGALGDPRDMAKAGLPESQCRAPKRCWVSCVSVAGVACRWRNCIGRCSTRSCICWPTGASTPTRVR